MVRLQRLGLTPRSVEREHQLAPQALPQRVLRDQRLELADELSAAAELEVGVDPLLERLQAQLLEPADLGLGERLEGEVGERWAAPQRERLAEQLRPLVPPAGLCLGDEALEAVRGRAARARRGAT